jgi:hypothetical protein
MRVIKLGIISIIVFSLLITGISLFFPSHVRISKAIDITTGKDSLMTYLIHPDYWKKWYPGADTADLIINGIRTSNGKELVVAAITDSTIITTGSGPGVKENGSGWNIFPGRIPNSFTVQWYMDFHLRWYPWEKFSSLLLEKRYGAMMEQGLTKLKALLEK